MVLTQSCKERRDRKGCGAGRCARPRKRVAARGCARARRATGGIACKHASAHGRASAMRCIAATRHGSPLRGTQNPTEIGLTNSLRLIHQSTMGLFREFPCPAGTAGFCVRWKRRRCAASQGQEDSGGHACMGRRNPLPAGRQRRPAATAASVVARSAPHLHHRPSQTAPRLVGFREHA